MRYILIILLFTACRFQPKQPVVVHDTIGAVEEIHITDTVWVHDTIRIYLPDKKCDSLKKQLFVAQYKVEKVKFYLSICLKKPSQDKFLKGWIKRAVE